MESVRHTVRTDEVQPAADDVSVFDASESAIQGAIYEPGRAGGLGGEHTGVDERSIQDGGPGNSSGAGSREAGLVGRIPLAAGGMVGMPCHDQWDVGRGAVPGID